MIRWVSPDDSTLVLRSQAPSQIGGSRPSLLRRAALISCGLSALQQAADGMFLGACGSEQAFVSNATRSDVLILVASPRGAQLWKSAAVMDGGKPHFRQSE